MKVRIIDEAGFVIGRATLSERGLMVHSKAERPFTNHPPRHYDGWGEFEEENLRDAFRCFISDRALKAGRTEGAIMSRLRRFMPGTWS